MPTISNGISDAEVETAVGSSITVRCDDGYKLVGNETVVCEESNTWGQLPECKWASKKNQRAESAHLAPSLDTC